ncbi:MAG: DUF4296 domain-containing protein [Flavobacteriales bacterium]|nr:DUF4296 domain-containing protein [Flavobacteriales bacterium]
MRQKANILSSIALITLLSFFSCSNDSNDKDIESKKIPDGIVLIDQHELAEIMAEAQLIESHGTVLRTMQPYYKDSLMNYYEGLYQKYDITEDDFLYSIKEYSKSPKEMDLIINDALAILKQKEIDLGNVELPKQSLNALSRQQIGDIIYETPLKTMMIEADPILAEFIRDSLFHYLDSFPEIVTDKGYEMESVRFTFVLNTSNSMMFNQLKEYLKNKTDKSEGND